MGILAEVQTPRVGRLHMRKPLPRDQFTPLDAENLGLNNNVNASAAGKALSDVICSSGNAVKIVEASPKDKDLLFVPDENLGAWVIEQTGRPMTLWRGDCYAHVEFRRESLLGMRQTFPNAKI